MRVIAAIMQAPDWNDYQAFLAIARAGHIGRAAVAMGVDPTTIGRRLRRLEARLGVTLFEQTRLGQVLTEAGESMLVNAEAMDLSASRISEASVSGGVAAGTIRVSCSEGLGGAFIAPRMGSFFEQYPLIKVDLVASNGFLSPSKREADLAVVLSRPSKGAVIASKVSDYALRLYASREYLVDREAPKTAEELIGQHRMVGYIPDLLYAPELDYLAEISPKLEADLRSSSINAQHRLIAAGLAIGVLPCFIGDADPTLVPLLPKRRIIRSFWMVTHKDTHKLSRIQAFKTWLVDEVHSAGAKLFLPN